MLGFVLWELRLFEVDLSSHNANPPCVFDGEAFPISDVADSRLGDAVAVLT